MDQPHVPSTLNNNLFNVLSGRTTDDISQTHLLEDFEDGKQLINSSSQPTTAIHSRNTSYGGFIQQPETERSKTSFHLAKGAATPFIKEQNSEFDQEQNALLNKDSSAQTPQSKISRKNSFGSNNHEINEKPQYLQKISRDSAMVSPTSDSQKFFENINEMQVDDFHPKVRKLSNVSHNSALSVSEKSEQAQKIILPPLQMVSPNPHAFNQQTEESVRDDMSEKSGKSEQNQVRIMENKSMVQVYNNQVEELKTRKEKSDKNLVQIDGPHTDRESQENDRKQADRTKKTKITMPQSQFFGGAGQSKQPGYIAQNDMKMNEIVNDRYLLDQARQFVPLQHVELTQNYNISDFEEHVRLLKMWKKAKIPDTQANYSLFKNDDFKIQITYEDEKENYSIKLMRVVRDETLIQFKLPVFTFEKYRASPPMNFELQFQLDCMNTYVRNEYWPEIQYFFGINDKNERKTFMFFQFNELSSNVVYLFHLTLINLFSQQNDSACLKITQNPVIFNSTPNGLSQNSNNYNSISGSNVIMLMTEPFIRMEEIITFMYESKNFMFSESQFQYLLLSVLNNCLNLDLHDLRHNNISTYSLCYGFESKKLKFINFFTAAHQRNNTRSSQSNGGMSSTSSSPLLANKTNPLVGKQSQIEDQLFNLGLVFMYFQYFRIKSRRKEEVIKITVAAVQKKFEEEEKELTDMIILELLETNPDKKTCFTIQDYIKLIETQGTPQEPVIDAENQRAMLEYVQTGHLAQMLSEQERKNSMIREINDQRQKTKLNLQNLPQSKGSTGGQSDHNSEQKSKKSLQDLEKEESFLYQKQRQWAIAKREWETCEFLLKTLQFAQCLEKMNELRKFYQLIYGKAYDFNKIDNFIWRIYIYIGQESKAEKRCDKYLNLFRKLNKFKTTGFGEDLISAAQLKLSLNNRPTAKQYLQEAISLFNSLVGFHHKTRISAIMLLSEIHFEDKEYSNVINILFPIMEFNSKIGNVEQRVEIYRLIGICYLKIGDLTLSEKHLQSCSLLIAGNDKLLQSAQSNEIQYFLSVVYRRQAQFKKAQSILDQLDKVQLDEEFKIQVSKLLNAVRKEEAQVLDQPTIIEAMLQDFQTHQSEFTKKLDEFQREMQMDVVTREELSNRREVVRFLRDIIIQITKIGDQLVQTSFNQETLECYRFSQDGWTLIYGPDHFYTKKHDHIIGIEKSKQNPLQGTA